VTLKSAMVEKKYTTNAVDVTAAQTAETEAVVASATPTALRPCVGKWKLDPLKPKSPYNQLRHGLNNGRGKKCHFPSDFTNFRQTAANFRQKSL